MVFEIIKGGSDRPISYYLCSGCRNDFLHLGGGGGKFYFFAASRHISDFFGASRQNLNFNKKIALLTEI